MSRHLRSRLARVEVLAQRKTGLDPFELLDVLAEMDRRTGGDGEPVHRGYSPPGARSWLEDHYEDWKIERAAGSPVGKGHL